MTTILYLNGTIYTMDAAQPRAQAMAIDSASGRILAVRDNDQGLRVGGRDTELIDLHGKTVLPGFIDAHIHLVETAYRRHSIHASRTSNAGEVAKLARQHGTQAPPRSMIQGG